MLTLTLFTSIILGVLTVLVCLRKSRPKRHWSNQTIGERTLLSIVLAGIFQFLFLLPGWSVAAYIVGYSGNTTTLLREVVFGLVTLATNTIIYFPLFYLPLRWFSNRYKLR